jgi:hypothetical protein
MARHKATPLISDRAFRCQKLPMLLPRAPAFVPQCLARRDTKRRTHGRVFRQRVQCGVTPRIGCMGFGIVSHHASSSTLAPTAPGRRSSTQRYAHAKRDTRTK